MRADPFFVEACAPYDPREHNCVAAVGAGVQHDPRSARALAIWQRHSARVLAAIKRPIDAVRVARHVAALADCDPCASLEGPAWGVSLQPNGAVLVLRRGRVWYGRAVPRGVYRVAPETVVAAFKVSPWTP